jgi:hypothetical protein
MSEYAYVRNKSVEQIVDIRPDLYAQWVAAGNPKAQSYLPVVNDPNPVYDPSIQIVDSFYVVEAARVRRAWSVRPKTEDELRRTWTPLEFLERFTPSELEDIESRRLTDPGVRTFYRSASFAQEIVSDDPRTIAGMDYLVSIGVITNARKEEILNG